MSRIADIDRLRAVAVLGTIYAHIPTLWLWNIEALEFMRKFTNGYAGVVLFFVISGFVISKSLLPKFDTARFSSDKTDVIKEFFIKRFFRITPLSLFWIFISYWVFYFTDPGLRIGNLYAAIASALNFFNVYTLINSQYQDLFGIYWSLSTEEQFYIVLPLLLIFAKSKKSRIIIISIACIINFIVYFFKSTPFAFMPIMFGMLWYFIFEIFKSKYPQSDAEHKGWQRVTFKIIALICIVLMFTFPNIQLKTNMNPGVYMALMSFVFTILVAIASMDKGYVINFKLTNAIVNWIGTRSFTIYLSHFPMIFLVRYVLMNNKSILGVKYNDNYNVQIFIIFVITTIAVSEMVYRLIEVKFMHIGVKFLQKRKKMYTISFPPFQ
ncbi:acyltransferase family protein [Dickeya fangzhongdai]|uniref:acyltransferase family protein n=1 Tax=Dickeya fangzhongdai TaxID=1778540 RepID=UPI0004F7807A|nr:acyltransferase [Dickeya fangzhongdai]AIR68127.1 hypothetical protein LH89_02490 [Dickeya fangzhongdai]KGT96552.1 hypothetical protein NM75_19705 [Dickeya fangzhongdai]KHN59548.1 hypothetical protein OI70_05615 [Dickeya fangzhongdai]